MKVHTQVVGWLQTNCYIVEDEPTGKCIVIDPGGDGQGILDFIDGKGLDLQYIVITHGHIDHFLEAGYLQSKKHAHVLISEADSRFLENPGWMRSFPGADSFVPPRQVKFVKEGDVIEFGETRLHVLETPGHSPGSICLYWPGSRHAGKHVQAMGEDTKDQCGNQGEPPVLFSGDLIFSASVGRTDLPGGSTRNLLDSIRNKVLTLPDDTVIYPGHDEPTTVGRERAENPFLF